jgi:ABC-type dipeptide/oligopeptide/nickel transport system permease component
MVPVSDRPALVALAGLGRRLLQGIVTAWAAVTLAFFALRAAVGDPVAGLVAQGLASAEQAEAIRRSLGFDRPLWVQYLDYLGGLTQGDLGASLFTARPVGRVIADQATATLGLAAAGLATALALGLALGSVSGWKRGTAWGGAATSAASLATALPVALVGVLALLGYNFGLAWLPQPLATRVLGFGLPAMVLGFSTAGPVARAVGSGLLESIDSAYILAARARGISGAPRLVWHALRPALTPVISLSALQAGYLLSGTVVTETVFARPGLGRLLVSSVVQGDFPVAQGLVVLAALIYTATQVIADALSMVIDPRLSGRL